MDGLGRSAVWICVAVACGVAQPICAQTADERFQVAAGHYSRGWYDRAAESFGEFASAFPNDPRVADARFFQGEAALAAGSLDVAREGFETLVAIDPAGERIPHAEFRLAEIAFRQERFEDAAKAYVDFVAARPDHPLAPNAAMQAGHAHWRRSAFDAAEAAYREGLAKAANENVAQEFRLALARTYAALDRRADAIRFYETVLAARPAEMSEAELRRELAECRFASDDFSAAAMEFATAFSAQTDLFVKQTLAARLVEAYSRAENWQALCNFADSEPGAAALAEVPAALSQYADALDRLERSDDAFAVREQLLEERFAEEVRAKALRQLALAAFDRGDVDQATSLCETHVSLMPLADADAALRSRWARALLAADKPAEAEKLLAKCLVLEGLSDEARAYLIHDQGIAVAKQDQPQRALEILQSAPDDVPVELARAIALAAADAATYAGDWTAAEDELRRYLAFEEGSGGDAIRRRLFVAVANRGNDDAEAARLLRALDKEGEADAFYWTALDRFLQRVQKSAPELFAEFEALRESDDAPEALVARSRLQEGFDALAKGDAERAEAAFRSVEASSPEGASARDAAWGLLELAATQADLVKVDRQIGRLKALKADEARLQQASLVRSRCLKDAGDLEGSVAELRALIASLDEDAALLPIAVFDLADRLAELRRDDESAAALERLIKEFAESPLAADAAYRLAERAYRLERTAECEALLTDLLARDPRGEIVEHALYLRGQNAAREDAWDRVAESMTKLIEAAPETTLRFEAEYWIAEALFRQKDFAGAGARFDSLAAQMKADEPAWKGMIPLRRAQILAAGSNFAEALALIAKFDEQFPEFRQRHEVDYLRGRCLARLGRFEEARTSFDSAIRSPWGGAGEIAAMAQWMIGETYFHQERFEEAVAAYELVEAKYDFPKWQATALLQAGKCYERLNRPEEAARNYAYLLKNYGDTPLAEEATKRLRATSNRPRQALRQAETKREVE